MYLLGHSFVDRYNRRAAQNRQSMGQATWLARECQLQAHGVSGGTINQLLASPGDLLRRLNDIPRVLDLLVAGVRRPRESF